MAEPNRITLGRGSYFAGPPEIVAVDSISRITIANYTSIALGCRFIIDAEHNPNWVTTTPPVLPMPGYNATKGDIVIGNDVWIGAHATILSGVTIGDGAVVGACSVVAKDVPPYAVAVGNPARVVKHRFSDEVIGRLLAIRWWEWSPEKITENKELLWSDRVQSFIERHGPPVR
jgi:acetyltransferase-like isoleucine patch superfamily enzyme